MSEELNEDFLEKYEELKVLLEVLQKDVEKHANGNKSAGVRTRKGLRAAKKLAAEIVKMSLSIDK
tara:strand:- start:17505 stop:17699 length:195 start_codon:yes stop_codon:yes gene_type:complete